MGKYTILNSAVDQQIDDCLDSIVRLIRQCFEGVVSIVLVGGFGRGEGVVSTQRDRFEILSDFDLYLVHRDGISSKLHEKVEQVRKVLDQRDYPLLENQNGRISLDLHFLSLSNLRRLPPRLRFFDLKHGSMVISGEDVLKLIPDFLPEDLPAYEGFRLLLNRIYYTGQQLSLECLRQPVLDEQTKQELSRETAKNYLVSCYALLILSGKYESSAIKSMEILEACFKQDFRGLAQQHPYLPHEIRSFVTQLLQGQPKSNCVQEAWFKSLSDLFTVIKFFQKQFVGMAEWDEFYVKTCKYHLRPYLASLIKKRSGLAVWSPAMSVLSIMAQLVQRAIWLTKTTAACKKVHWRILTDYRDPAIKIYTALLFLFRSIKKDGSLDNDLFALAQHYLYDVYPCGLVDRATAETAEFDRILRNCIDAYDLNFGKGPTVSNDAVEIVFRVVQ